MEIVDNKLLVFKTRNPHKYNLIPKHKVLRHFENGGAEIAVYWSLDEVRVLKNLGVRDVPSPIYGRYDWPGRYTPMAHQKETASFLTLHRRAFVLSEPGCVDADTEYLSPTGWKRIADYTGGQVAQYHPDTGEAEFVTPTEFVKLPCQDMVRIKTHYGLDQLLSPEHRVVVRSNAADKWCVMSAAELLDKHDKWHAGIRLPRNDASISFSHAAIPTAFRIKGVEAGIPLTDAQLRVQIAVIADAYFGNNTTLCTVRLKCERKVQRMRTLLIDAGIEYTAREQNTATATGFTIFRFRAPWHVKEFDERFWQATPEQLRLIGEEVLHWDGTIRGGNKGGSFSTTSKASADFIQYAWAATGTTARITEDARPDKYKGGVCYTVQQRGEVRGGEHGLLTLRNRNSATMYPAPSTDGYKYCFMVPSTYLVLRRNGCVFLTGNTGKTLSALWAADYLMQRGEVRRVLILCPLSIMHSAWMQDIGNSIIHRSAVVAHHAQAARRIEIIQQDFEIVIINYEGLNLVADEVRNDGRFDLIIVDEANAYKNAQTKRWKALASILKPETYLWMMTGTPASQSPMDAFGLAKLVNPNGVPKFMTAWRDMVMNKLTMFKWAPKRDAAEKVHKALQPAIRFTKAQCLDLPPVVTMTREVPLTPQQAKYYNLIKDQMVAQASGETITAVNAAAALNKLLQISCIAYNTPVLTNHGWVPIQSLQADDLVWDGVEFVKHKGLLPRGRKRTIVQYGVRMTPDHEVLTNEGWRVASACAGLDRASVRLPDRSVSSRYERWENQKGPLALSLSVRQRSDTREPVPSYEASSDATTLWLSARQQNAQHVEDPAVPHLVQHATTLLVTTRQRLAQLWSAWHHSVRALGNELRFLLGGHGAYIQADAIVGASRQQRTVFSEQLPLGNRARTSPQHTQHRVVGYAKGANDFGRRSQSVRAAVSYVGRKIDTLPVAARESADDAWEEDVFDIAFCGPRSRFVVQGTDGQPLIVHNCGAAYTDNKEVVEFDATPRLNVLLEALEETDRKVIIFALFRSVIDTISQFLNKNGIACEEIHGGVTATKRGDIIKRFQTQDTPRVLVMQPAAAAHGITLTAADTVIFYGPLMSVEQYVQCCARADRKGQNADKVTVIHIQGSPVEKRAFAALSGKVDDAQLLVDLFTAEIKERGLPDSKGRV